MCLRINSQIHPNLQPLVAEEDIMVFKVLEHKKYEWKTPYRNKRVFFFFGKAKLHAKLNVENDEYVDKGIHSCLRSSTAASILLSNCDDGKVFTAIIPKGAEYFIGRWGDVVSNKLIIYKTTKKCV